MKNPSITPPGASLDVADEKVFPALDFLYATQGVKQTNGFGRLSLADLCALVRAPRIGSKQSAPCFAPHAGAAKTKEAARAALFKVIILDFDDGGHDAHSIKRMFSDTAYLAWTSSSHTVEEPRWKVVIPLAHPINATAWLPIAQGAALTHGTDPAQARIQQVCFIPNKLVDDAPYEFLIHFECDALDPSGALAQSFAARFEEEGRREETPKVQQKPQGMPWSVGGNGNSIIELANRAYNLRSILLQNGYKQRGERFLAPNSSSGNPGVNILIGDDGFERAYSHHTSDSDPLADEHAHSAFDLLLKFRFGDNMTTAIRTLADELNPEGQKQRQREYSKAKAHEGRTESVTKQMQETQVAKQNESSEDTDFLTAPPQLAPEGLYGLIGDIARTGSAGKEVNPDSVALAAIIRLSALVARDLYLQIGDERHSLNLYGLHVGRSMLGGKGESFALLKRIEAKLASDKNGGAVTLGQSHTSGLSSREGLTMLIHDGYSHGKEDYPPVNDKRLFIRESEFANLLAQSKRDGNTISPALRDVWDAGQSIKPLTKNNQIWASDPHIGLHGAITPIEFRAKLDSNEASNGFLNRFLVIFAERTRLIPFPERTKQIDVDILANRIEKVVMWAKGGYPESKYTRRMEMSDSAKAIWSTAYFQIKKRGALGETINAMLERRAPITLRLAALFAVTDLTLIIEAQHLQAALAWAEYHLESIVFIFGSDPKQKEKAEHLNEYRTRIMTALANGGWVTRTAIRKAFSNRLDTNLLDEALAGMLADKHIERSELKNTTNAGKKISYRTAQSALSTQTGEESACTPCARPAQICVNQNDRANNTQPGEPESVDCAGLRTDNAGQEPPQSSVCAENASCIVHDEIIAEVEI